MWEEKGRGKERKGGPIAGNNILGSESKYGKISLRSCNRRRRKEEERSDSSSRISFPPAKKPPPTVRKMCVGSLLPPPSGALAVSAI